MPFDPLIIIGLAALGTLVLVVVMLNRAWGDFPRRVGPAASTTPVPTALEGGEDAEDADEGDGEAYALPAGAPEGELIPITHPMVRRAIDQALDRGGSPYATYFVRDEGQIYFASYRIADPAQRGQLTRLFRSLNDGDFSQVNMSEIMSAMQQLGRRS